MPTPVIHSRERHMPDAYSPDKPGMTAYAFHYPDHQPNHRAHLKLTVDYVVDINIDTTWRGIEALRDVCNVLLVQRPEGAS